MKFGALALILALLATPACNGGGAGADPGGSPTLVAASFVAEQPSPEPNSVAMAEGQKTNDVVTVNVTLTGTNGVYGAALDVVYDSIHTTYLGYAPGTVFEQGGASTYYEVAAEPGATLPRIAIGVSRVGVTGATDVIGTKTVIALRFRVNQPGVFPLTIANPVVYDSQPTPQPIPGIAWFAGAVRGV